MKDIDISEFKCICSDGLESSFNKISVDFKILTDSYPKLKELRDFVEQNAFGFGEREFLYMHKMVVDSFEKNELTMLEIGVFRGQVLTLYGLLRSLCNKTIDIVGLSPLNSTDGHWESDYKKDLEIISEKFNVPVPKILEGLSTDPNVFSICKYYYLQKGIDILYIDGGHTKEVVKSDIVNYSPMVNKDGYLIIDDSANNLSGCFSGKFWGIKDVSDTVDSILPPLTENNDWEYIGNVIHNRIWKRI